MKSYPGRYRYPFTPYPKGWYRVERTSFVAPGESKRIQVFGESLGLSRDSGGNVALRNSDRTFPTAEVSGLIFCYYDPNAGMPFFNIPSVNEFKDPTWYPPFHLNWKCKVHIQEVAENALDLSHFCTVHTYKEIPYISKFETDHHQFNVIMHSRRRVLGVVVPTTMDIVYHGMGYVIANVNAAGGIQLKVLLNTTPIDFENVEIHMEVGIKKSRNPVKDVIVRSVFPKEIWNEFYRDIPVWEAKLYRSKPILCRDENNIIRIRNWAKQFYTESSSVPERVSG